MSALAGVAIGAQYLNRCSTPAQGSGSPTNFIEQKALSSIGKQSIPYQDIVPCPECCRTYVAPVIDGSATVFNNQLSTSRLSNQILGLSGTIPALVGSPTVFIG